MKQTDEYSMNSFQNSRKIGCVIMASGVSKRFGSNKLLAEYKGKSLLQRILDITGTGIFERRVVITRSKEVEKICHEQGIDVIFHTLPGRNDTVRMGTEYMKDMDGIMFCPCDQPALRQESLKQMIHMMQEDETILRLAFGKNVGAPVLFGKAYFDELSNLPEQKGGAVVINNHMENVKLVQAQHESELFDIDRPEDFMKFTVCDIP